jgi:hypothetical protein
VPTVSVLLPAYNGELYLRQAIDSILNQTFTDFDLVILNDGSTDGTAAIIDSYDDPRIKAIHQPENLGLSETLNRAISSCLDSHYIARMDQDDISLPYRLEKQVAYMEAHPRVGLLATNVQFIDETGQSLFDGSQHYPPTVSGHYVRWRLLWENSIIHPSVMLRSEVLVKTGMRFKPDYYPSDDYRMWLDLASAGVLIDIISEICLHYRIVSTSISRQNRERQLENRFVFVQENVQNKMQSTLHGSAAARGLRTLAAHTTLQPQIEPDYPAAARLLIRLALHYIHTGPTRADRTKIYQDVEKTLNQFISGAEAQGDRRASRQVIALRLLFRYYVRHFSKFVRRLPIHRKVADN